MTVLINRGVPVELISARTGTGASNTFALPNKACVLAWQTAFNVNPSVIDIDIDVSIDGLVWTTLDTSTVVGGETRLINTPTGALFLRAIVNTNTGNRQVTVTLVAKPNP